MRDMGAQRPTTATIGCFASSFYAGWQEADGAIMLLMREQRHPFDGADQGCDVCGLAKSDRVHR